MDQVFGSNELKERVRTRIARYEERRLRLRVAGLGVAVVGSLGLLAAGAVAVLGDVSQSGFAEFASLFFSNFSAAMASFSDLMLSLVESFPVFSAALLLGGVFAALWSVARFADGIALARARHVRLI